MNRCIMPALFSPSRLVILVFLILRLSINGTSAEKNKYYHISTLCGQKIFHPLYKKIDGVVLTSESEDNLKCVITFQTDSILQKFMLRFDHLALDCNDHLFVYDGDNAYGTHKAHLSCRSTKRNVGTIFTQSNFVTLKYITDKWSKLGNGFKLIITAFKTSPVGCQDFQCLNTFCISEDLTCDNINHCGDNSDETSLALCPNEPAENLILGIGVTVFVSIIVSTVVICFLCVVGIVVCICQRQRQSDHDPLAPHYPGYNNGSFISPMPGQQQATNYLLTPEMRMSGSCLAKLPTGQPSENWLV
ncbi:uncharacterized protein LOC143231731 isoform X2 [Tachypleus tridentatus]|uniref:uncharacterized protein LOC143231731 isoform X2 n=1 Tax=Tachypleus tridentatus TaxID=6853 RepID=UPI003FCF7B42